MTLTFTVTNISDWMVILNYMPPTVTIRSIQEAHEPSSKSIGSKSHRLRVSDFLVLIFWC